MNSTFFEATSTNTKIASEFILLPLNQNFDMSLSNKAAHISLDFFKIEGRISTED